MTEARGPAAVARGHASRLPVAVAALAVALPVALLPAAAPAGASTTLRSAYTTASTVPDPTASGLPRDTCDGIPASRARRPVRLPSRGLLQVWLSSAGDWALVVRTRGNVRLAASDSAGPGEPEHVSVRVRGATTVLLDACNFLGGPTARVSYTFTPR